jgi:hypothetical protein
MPRTLLATLILPAAVTADPAEEITAAWTPSLTFLVRP